MLKRAISWALKPIKGYVLNKATQSPRFADVHYALSTEFNREHFAVLQGMERYRCRDSITELGPSSADYPLRRNVHRIEKGLISPSFRSVFATEFIVETVQLYGDLISTRSASSDGVVRWASDVLDEYFERAGEHDSIQQAKNLYRELRENGTTRDPYGPFIRPALGGDSVTFEALLELAKRRRSVRWFKEQPVPRELLLKALEVATLSPSACNRQPYRFAFFDDKGLAAKACDIPVGSRTFSHQVPVTAAIIGDLSAFECEADRHVIYIDAALAAMSFQFALETLGLSSCSINWRDSYYEEVALREFMDLKPYERCVMFMAIGYPAEKERVPYSQKRTPEQLSSFNQIRK